MIEKKDQIVAAGISVGIREAKARLSQLLKIVRKGNEIVLTERGRPVGKIVPLPKEGRSLAARIGDLEDAGVIEVASARPRQNLPPPIPVGGEVAQRLLREDREGGYGDGS
jgi:prevent-host-death family protein